MYMYVITIVYIHEIEEIHVHVGQSKCIYTEQPWTGFKPAHSGVLVCVAVMD